LARGFIRAGTATICNRAMNLDLSDEETAALIRELHDIVESDKFPVLAAHPHPEGDSWEAQA
jgi:hypothetical protein